MQPFSPIFLSKRGWVSCRQLDRFENEGMSRFSLLFGLVASDSSSFVYFGCLAKSASNAMHRAV